MSDADDPEIVRTLSFIKKKVLAEAENPTEPEKKPKARPSILKLSTKQRIGEGRFKGEPLPKDAVALRVMIREIVQEELALETVRRLPEDARKLPEDLSD